MTRDEFFTALETGAKWDIGVSINRTNPVPIDANSVFKTYANLETYAKTNPVAHPGQIVAVIDESNVATAYLINTTGENAVISKLAASTASGDIEETLTSLQSSVSALQTTVGNAESGLVKDVNDNKTAIEALQTTLSGLSGALKFVGTSTTDPATGTVTIDGEVYTPKAGDVVIYNSKEFIYNGTAWDELGDESSYVLKTTTINGHALTGNVTLSANDINGLADFITSTTSSSTNSLIEQINTLSTKVDGKLDKTALPSGSGIVTIADGTLSIDPNTYLTSVPQATQDAFGGIKLNHAEGGNEHAVKLDGEGRAYVTVSIPAAITYTADETSLTLSGNVFAIKDGGVTTEKLVDNAVTDVKIAAVDVTKLVQTTEDTLVLDGGNAAGETTVKE